jgi:hypothetical protein
MLDILGYLPVKRKATPSGWVSFNAVCCAHNGSDTVDRRSRGGLKPTDQGWSYHCFNCNYTASFILGRILSYKARRLLSWLGVPDAEIDVLNLESLRHRSIHGILDDRQRMFNTLAGIEFAEQELPALSELLTGEDPRRGYLRLRRVPDDYPVMIQDHPEKSWKHRPSVIIPFTYNDRIVGHTQRFLDDRRPKYISNSQPGYVFGTDLQHSDWTHVIVVEGIFDALCIGGLAVMHSTISDEQARLIRSLGREITVVPDQDAAGMELVDRAVELGWAVSMPPWPADIKDVNDSVMRYGRLATVLTIFENRETSKIKIELRKKNLVKRLRS